MTTAPVDLFSPDLLADPYAGFSRLREQAPVLSASMMGGPPMWLVTRYADVRAVLTDTRFANNPATAGGPDIRAALMAQLGLPAEMTDHLAQNILNADGADHTRLRRLVARAFTVRRVSELRPRVEEITESLLDALAAAAAGGAPVDLVEAFSYPLPITVICELVGIDEPERAQWHRWGRDLSSMDREAMPVALREMVAHVQDVIARRRAEPSGDLLTALVAAQYDDGDRLTDKEMVTMVIALVIAGHETTAHLVSNAVLALLTNPAQLARLRARDTLWPQAVHELMRLRGPVQLLQTRYAVCDVELGGTLIPAGAPVQAVVVSANTDPREFDAPDRLDVEREVGRGEGHLGFGQGAHYCLGAALARQEAEVALRALLTRFPGLRLAVPAEEIRFVERPGFRRVEALPLTGF